MTDVEQVWETSTEYGHMTELGWIFEYRGRNYATHQRTVKRGAPEPIPWTDYQDGSATND